MAAGSGSNGAAGSGSNGTAGSINRGAAVAAESGSGGAEGAAESVHERAAESGSEGVAKSGSEGAAESISVMAAQGVDVGVSGPCYNEERAGTAAQLNEEVRNALRMWTEENTPVHQLSRRNQINVTPDMLSRLQVPSHGAEESAYLDDRTMEICLSLCIQNTEHVSLVGKSTFFYNKLIPTDGQWLHRSVATTHSL